MTNKEHCVTIKSIVIDELHELADSLKPEFEPISDADYEYGVKCVFHIKDRKRHFAYVIHKKDLDIDKQVASIIETMYFDLNNL